ncbi:MAG: hypothetical protein IJ447_06555 [Clostridia bacterium]|nr:hypothetical protein [Clostridia bacterium]
MKKITAVFLAIVLLLSTLTLAVFAEGNQLVLGESVEISFDADESFVYTFKPTRAGNYKITVTGGAKSAVETKIYNAVAPEKILDEGFVMTTDEKYYMCGAVSLKNLMAQLDTEEEEFLYMNAKPGREFVLKLTDVTSMVEEAFEAFKGLAECFTPSTVTVTVEATELQPIKPGHRPHVSHKEVFEFIPDHSGKYRFTSELTDGAVPEITICDYTGCVATSEAFTTASGESDLDFDVTVDLQAGETYLVHCDNTAVNEENESIGSFSVEVEEIVGSNITDISYEKSLDTHNTFTVTANGRPAMIQFIEPDGGTRTYDRSNQNVTIKSYDADGNEVNSLDRTVTYEVWDIYSNMSAGVEIRTRAKYLDGAVYTWDTSTYSFTVELLEIEIDAGVRSITPSATSGNKGAVVTTVVTGPDAQGVRFRMANGTTTTYYSSKAVTLENGDLEFTGKAWMNEDGENVVTVLVRSNNIWNEVGTIEYTVE